MRGDISYQDKDDPKKRCVHLPIRRREKKNFMEERRQTLSELSKDISCKLLDSINLLRVLEEINDGDSKTGVILSSLKDKTTSAFHKIEE